MVCVIFANLSVGGGEAMKKYRRVRRPGLQKKFSLFVMIIIAILVLFQLAFNNFVVSRMFVQVERIGIEENIENTAKIWNGKTEQLASLAREYGAWSEAYRNMNSNECDMDFFEENFTDSIPFNFGVDIVSVIRSDGEIIKHHGNDLGFAKKIMSLESTKRVLGSNIEGNGYFEVSGYAYYNSVLYLVTVVPVIKSDYSGVPAGVLVIGDRIDDEMLQDLKEKFRLDIFFSSDDRVLAATDDIRAMVKDKKTGLEQKIALIMGQESDGYRIKTMEIYSICGEKIGNFGIVKSTEVFKRVERIMNISVISALIFSSMLVLAVSGRFRKDVITPIKRLEEQVSIMNTSNTLIKLKESGPNEIIRLTAAFNGMVEKIAKSTSENNKLRTMSKQDELTGLYNHRHFHEVFEEKVNLGMKNISIIFADVDKFKNINSEYGYEAGDMLLVEIAKHLKTGVPEGSEVFRYGGEEFAVMLTGKSSENSKAIAERLRIGLGKNFNIQRYSDHMPVTMSIGIASYPVDSTTSHGLVQKGEVAVRYSKQLGRNIVIAYSKDIERHIFRYSEKFTQDMFIDSVIAITKAVDAKDAYTGLHSDNVAKYSLLLAEKIGFSEGQIYKLRIGALLHDCGKIGIPDMIINKPSKLNEIEAEYIRKHPVLGYNIVKNIVEDDDILSCVRYHHERWNGSGYPDGLRGEEIPLYARIVCIADSFHAMVSDRPYRKGLSFRKALNEIERNANIQFDPYLAHEFVKCVRSEEQSK